MRINGIKTSGVQPPAWSASAEEILRNIRHLMDDMKAKDVLNMVFEYSDVVPRSQAVRMDRKHFDDGRYRVFLHPSHEEALEKALDEERARRNTE